MAKLPPLNALRAFEAAARHLSFSKAADELFVTPAAVSHQIKGLERWLDVDLFKRVNRSVFLTEEGQSYVVDIREALEQISSATEKLIKRDAAGPINVNTLPSFAVRWLLPRLSRFREKHPDIDVRLTTSDQLTDFAREEVDVVIRYGSGNYKGLREDKLLTEDTLFPVCSPKLFKGDHPLRNPGDLAHHTLLHDDLRVDWAMWLAAAGVKGVDAKRGPSFNDSSMVLIAAMEGQGVALGRSTLAAADLAAGRLVKPFDVSLKAEQAYFILCPHETADRPRIQAFRNWLLEEAGTDPGRFMSASVEAAAVVAEST